MRIKAQDIINFRKLSYLLTGSATKIHSKFTPKEYKNNVEELINVINYWLEGKTIVSEDEINNVLNEFLIFVKEKLNKTVK